MEGKMKAQNIALVIALLLTATTASMAQSDLRNYTHIASSQAGSSQAGPGSVAESQRRSFITRESPGYSSGTRHGRKST
jgi:hypothetical protein